jgi:hypothetical protein
MNHGQPTHHCDGGVWYCGKINSRCNGHASWQPNHRHGHNAILLLDGNIEADLQAFEHSMTFSSSQSLLFALRAYFNFKAVNRSLVARPYLFFVDFGLPSSEHRGIVFDMVSRTVYQRPFAVSHGEGSGTGAVPTVFSNNEGSRQSSLGLYLTGNTYDFPRYNTRALRLDGHSGSFNSAARTRGIVMHPAPYVGSSHAGTSHGCPAISMSRVSLVETLAHGSVVFHFSPNDSNWKDYDPWVNYRGYPAADSSRSLF